MSKRNEPVDSLEWSADGTMYAWCSGNRVTVRATDSGKDLLDAEVPSRINELVLMEGGQGVFVAAACNDGSLPVLAVQALDGSQQERRAILAIEPVDNQVAGEERFKCIRKIEAYRVATCNSAGVVSVMNLEGAVRMILSDSTDENSQGVQSDDDNDSEEDDELAVDIVESVRLGTGARITSLAVWYSNDSVEVTEDIEKPIATVEEEELVSLVNDATTEAKRAKRKQDEVDMDTATVEKARSLVKQAKKIKKKSQRKKKRVAEA